MNKWGIIFVSVFLSLIIGFCIWWNVSYTCAKWGPYYWRIMTISSGKTTTVIKQETARGGYPTNESQNI